MAVYYTYMVLCSDSSLYTGYTDNLVRRIRAHNSGKGAKYTRTRRPVKLVYWERFATKQQAMQREYAIKQWPRSRKLLLLSEEQRERYEKINCD
ncbi:MAG: GIY-YIG nuclease family protein [Peptococcaceae bacterium]|nr:GIY-YIG nuclease family protein [Peptococcaceae bacterium]